MSGDRPPLPRIVVTAAVVEEDGRYLLTRRIRGVHLEGFWEFPGGKCEGGETEARCLEREMLEELGTTIEILDEILTTSHAYADRIVELHFYRCRLTGVPRAQLGQEMRWVNREELRTLELPPADATLIDLLSRAAER